MARFVSWILAAAALPVAAMAQPATPPTATAGAPAALLADRLTGDTSPVHDPSMIRDGDTFYLFTTTSDPKGGGFIQVRTSKNLLQ